jgi:hypothetical protein
VALPKALGSALGRARLWRLYSRLLISKKELSLKGVSILSEFLLDAEISL